MNQAVVDYLQKNKDLYAKEALIVQLKAAGFSDQDIEEGVSIAYENDLQAAPVSMPVQMELSKSKWSFTKLGVFLSLLYLGIVLIPLMRGESMDSVEMMVLVISFPVSIVVNVLIIPLMIADVAPEIITMAHCVISILISMILIYFAGNFFSNRMASQNIDSTEKMIDYKNARGKLIKHLIRRGIGPAVLSVMIVGAFLSFIIDDLNTTSFVVMYLPLGGIILTTALVAISAVAAIKFGKNDLNRTQLLTIIFSIILAAVSMAIMTIGQAIIVGPY